MSELITVAVYMDETKAYLTRALLEREGIPCFLADEYFTALRRFCEPLAGVRLQVPADVAEDALKLLAQEDEPVPSSETRGAGLPRGVCPQCGGRDVASRIALFVLFLVFMLPFLGKRYRCRTCEYRWN